MHPVIVLWGTPRTTSTAFEWMMRMRGDMICFHEPFGEAWYKGDDALWPRLAPDSPRVPGLTRQVVLQRIEKACAERPVFVKDFPHYIADMVGDAFLDRFTHSFLIRDPAKSVPSIYKRGPEYVEAEYGFTEHRALFDRVTEYLGHIPPVIDSDDLLEDPHGIVEAWSRAVDIPFRPDALRWEPGARDEVSWYDDGSWHGPLAQSDGLKPQTRTYGSVEDQPAHVQEIYAKALPHYSHIHRHRLTAERAPA
ncbi:MAG: sulfotransferase family protein [Pseudomonadota bacterium]